MHVPSAVHSARKNDQDQRGAPTPALGEVYHDTRLECTRLGHKESRTKIRLLD